jgi:hypothetical protein
MVKSISAGAMPMNIAIEPPLASRIRAFAEAHPDMNERQIARRLGLLTSRVKNALSKDPRPRVKSMAR